MPPPAQPERTCSRCIATATATGARCRNRTCRSQYCWQHLKRDRGLRVKPSGVAGGAAGYGLYATRLIPSHRVIDTYSGIEMTRRELNDLYGAVDANYALCRSRKRDPGGARCVDARRTNASAARFANTTTAQQRGRRNAKLTSNFSLRSTKNIRPNQEIFTPYNASASFGLG